MPMPETRTGERTRGTLPLLSMSVPLRRARVAATIAAAAWFVAGASGAAAQKKTPARPPDVFDDLYSRGKKANDAMKTLTARFTETTASSLLTKPLVAKGRVAVERPSRVVLRYTEPDARTVLIDGNKMTMSWPSRHLKQVSDIGTAQGRVQKYFINGTADDLHREFEIEDHGTSDRPGTYYVTMIPKRKQIKENLVRLDLWIDRTSLLLDTMKMTFANGDTKTMTFEDVLPNAPIEPGTFSLER
jgi:outer membrane lipoprotein-sorting protein